MADVDTEKNVKVSRPGLKGLITGIAPEDAAKECAADLMNMRIDQLGRLSVRLGYNVILHSLESGTDRIVCILPLAEASEFGVGDVFLTGLSPYGGAGDIRFYEDSTERKEYAGAGQVTHVNGVQIYNELQPINLVAVGNEGLYRQYSNAGTFVALQLPVEQGNATGMAAADQGAGTFLIGVNYVFKIACYNSKTGAFGELSSATIGHTPAGNNVGVRLSAIPVYTGDEADHLHRKIYSRIQGETTWRLIDTIENNTDVTYDVTTAPTSDMDTPVFETDPPVPNEFAPMARWLGYTWVADDDSIYWSIADHSLMFDTTNNRIPSRGKPIALVAAADRLWVFTTIGLYYIPRPQTLSAANLNLIKFSGDVISGRDAQTAVLCAGSLVYFSRNRLKTTDSKLSLQPMGALFEMTPKSGEYGPKRRFGHYDGLRNRYMLFTVKDGRTTFPDYACSEVYLYDFDRRMVLKDSYRGLFPCCINGITLVSYYPPVLCVGGAYGVVAAIEGSYEAFAVPASPYHNDGYAAAISVSGTATGGGTDNLDDSGAAFTDAVIGCSCVIFDVDGVGETWAQMVVVPIKARTGTKLTFGHNVGFNIDAGDKYYVGGIPWLVKTPALALGNYLVRRVEIEHWEEMGAIDILNGAILVIPESPAGQTAWMYGGALGFASALEMAISDSRQEGLYTAALNPQMRCQAPQIQICGYKQRTTISEIRAELEKLPEL